MILQVCNASTNFKLTFPMIIYPIFIHEFVITICYKVLITIWPFSLIQEMPKNMAKAVYETQN